MAKRTWRVLALSLALGGGVGAAGGGQDPLLDERMPPFDRELSGSQKTPVRVAVGIEGVEGLASYDLLDRTVRIRWHYRVVGARDTSMCDPTTWTHTQEIALAMWPTELVALGPRELLVAGVDEESLVVERIVLAPLEALPALGTDAEGGEGVLPELTLAVESRRTVLREPRQEGRYVSAMFPNRGKPGAAFVVFDGSHELHELELATGATTRIATPTGPLEPFVLVVPELERRFSSLGDGDHDRLGYVYWFYSTDSGAQPPLVFADVDRDGVLDSARLEDWTATLCSELRELR